VGGGWTHVADTLFSLQPVVSIYRPETSRVGMCKVCAVMTRMQIHVNFCETERPGEWAHTNVCGVLNT
jgi:hypothetical protein